MRHKRITSINFREKQVTQGQQMDEKIKQLWKSGQTVVCGWLLLPDALTAEIMANQGYDTVTIDLQHGLILLTIKKHCRCSRP